MLNIPPDHPIAAELPLYISVDIETAGPTPHDYSMLSIGACTLPEPRQTFDILLQPVNERMEPEAHAIHKLSPARLRDKGLPPHEAMLHFEAWLAQVIPAGRQPIFVAFNAPFDWMFVNEYFHRYLGRNPFGHSALDIKALLMGARGVAWEQTSRRQIAVQDHKTKPLTHLALQDALDQADLFALLLDELASRQPIPKETR